MIIDLAYDQRGNTKSDKRTIGGQIYTTTYEYDLADRIFKVNYPSGRIVTYNRDADGRIIQVTTKQNSTAASVTLSNSIIYQPMSRLLQSMTYGNGLNDWNTYTANYELDVLGVYNGAASVINRAHTRTDAQNLTSIFDNVTPANNASFWMSDANRLQNANGPWGAKTFYYDGVGNRTQEISTPTGGATTTDVLGYPSTSNRVVQITRGAQTVRQMTYDAAGNLLTDGGNTYTYNKRNRMAAATIGAIVWNYTYNGKEQLAIRAKVSPAATTHFIHDLWGNVLAETNGTATGTTREYIWLPEVEIAPVTRCWTTPPGAPKV